MNERATLIQALFPRVVKNYTTLQHRQVQILQEWIFELVAMYKVSKNTAALALNLINNFLAVTPFDSSKLQITGTACLSLAAQVNEIYAPSADDYVYVADSAYTLEEFNAFSVEVVNALGGKIRPCTALDVLAENLYRLSEKDSEMKYDSIGHARNVALILYTYLPKYWRLSATSMADLCISAARYLISGNPVAKTDLETINNLKHFESRFSKVMKKKLTNTIELFKNVSSVKLRIPVEKVTAEAMPSLPKPWEGDCEEIEELGEGTFGTVHKVRCDGRVLAVKRQEFSETALQELSILSTYSHANVIGVIEKKVTFDGIEIFMEVGRSLYDILYFSDGRRDAWEMIYVDGGLEEDFLLLESERRGYILDICAGLDYLHKHGVIHRDLKPGNIIVVDGQAKIADFGLSTQCILSLWDISPKQREVLTLWYRPPEFLDQDFNGDFERYSFEIDIWSLACILLEIETGVPAFPGENPFHKTPGGTVVFDPEGATLNAIGEVLGSAPKEYYPKLNFEEKEDRLACIRDEDERDILLSMLNWVPKQRLTADDVLDRFVSRF